MADGDQQEKIDGNKEEVKNFTYDQFNESEWRNALSEEHATDSTLADVKTFDDLTKGFIHAQRNFGKEKTLLPREDWEEDGEDYNNFYKAIGRPDTDEGYEFELPEGASEEWKINEEYETEFKKSAYKAGLNKKQASAQWDFIQKQNMDSMTEITESNKKRITEGTDSLKKEYGAKFEEQFQKMNNMVMHIDKDGSIRKMLTETGAGQEPEIQRLLMKISESFGEDGITSNKPATAILTPKEAQSKLAKWDAEIYAPKSTHILNQPTHPDYDKTKAEYDKLNAFAYPEPRV